MAIKKFFCPECSTDLTCNFGCQHDCPCGWKQPKEDEQLHTVEVWNPGNNFEVTVIDEIRKVTLDELLGYPEQVKTV